MFVDGLTVATLSAINVTIAASVFILSSAVRYDDAASRIWSVAFTAIILTSISLGIHAYAPGDASWAVPIAHAAFATAMALVWSGMRALNGRRSLLWVSVPVSVGLGVSGLIGAEFAPEVADTAQFFVASAVFCVLFAIECLSVGSAASVAARISASLFTGVALYQVARTSVLLIFGLERGVWPQVFGLTASNMILQGLCMVAVVLFMTMQSEGAHRRGEADERNAENEGMLGLERFRGVAEVWLRRSIRERTVLLFVLVEVAGYREISTAFGREAGRRAARAIGRIASDEAPLSSVVGRVSADRFAILTAVPADDDVDAIANRINARVLRTSIDEDDRFRAAAYFGVATTRDLESRYEALSAAAAANLVEARAAAAPGEIFDAA